MGKKTHFEQIPLEMMKRAIAEPAKTNETDGQDPIISPHEMSDGKPNSGKRKGLTKSSSERSL
jgi:hypothetical protein